MSSSIYIWPRALYGAIALLALGTVTASLMESGAPTMSADDLKIVLRELRSQAVEGGLIAEALLSGKATAAYARGQVSFLEDKTKDTLRELSDAKAPSERQPLLSQSRLIAQRAGADFSRLLSPDRSEDALKAVKQDLDRIVRDTLDLQARVVGQ